MSALLRHALAPVALSLACLFLGHRWDSPSGAFCSRCRLGFGNYMSGRWLSSRNNWSDGWPECEASLDVELSRLAEHMRRRVFPVEPKP